MVVAVFAMEDEVMDATGNPSPPDPYGDADRANDLTADVHDADASSDAQSADTSIDAADTDAGPDVGVPSDPEEIDGLIDSSLTDDDFDNFVRDDRPGGFEDVLSRPATPPPPPPMAPPAVRKLVRDPYSRLGGGVCSGLAHYFGLDVALVRVAVVLGSFLTGIGFIVYFIAWAVIPRATMWPPVGRFPGEGGSSISNRNMTAGAIVLGLLILLGVTGGPGEVLVPIVLVAGGVALLRRSPAPAPVAAGPMGGAATATAMGGVSVPPPPGPTGWETVVPQPVPPRSRRRRALRMLAVVPLVIIPLAVVGGLVAFVASNDDTGFRIDEDGFDLTIDGGPNLVRPATPGDLEPAYEFRAGSFELDLRQLDDAAFTESMDIDIDMDIGEIDVIVPEGLSVAVQAETNLGDITVFDSHSEGINPQLQSLDPEPSLFLDLELDVGDIDVIRAS